MHKAPHSRRWLGLSVYECALFDNSGRYQYDTSMKSIHIRAVHPDTLAALKRLARSHHRSLQGELLTILDRAARLAPPETEEEEPSWITVDTGGSSTWPRSELYDDQGR